MTNATTDREANAAIAQIMLAELNEMEEYKRLYIDTATSGATHYHSHCLNLLGFVTELNTVLNTL